MSDDEITSLEAGPALDTLVAERVFGQVACDAWRRANRGSAGGPVMSKRDDACEHGEGGCYPPAQGWPGSGPRRYSTDIGAAFAVVEHLRTQGWLIRVQEMPDGYPYLDGDSGRPAFYAHSLVTLDWMPDRTVDDLRKRLRTHIMERGRTPAEAICKAALSAIAADARGYDYPLFGPKAEA